MNRTPVLCAFLVFLFVGQAQGVVLGPELLINGSFELPDIPSGTFSVTTSIPGWTSTVGTGFEIQDNVAGSPFDGDQHIELDGFDSSNVFQNVATQAGHLYHVQFAYSPRPGVNPNNIQVRWDGSPLTMLNGNGLGLPDTSWSLFEFDVFATGASTPLEFLDIGPSNSLGGYLDAASVREVVSEIPEPGTILLLGLGTLVATYHRRRTFQDTRKPRH